LLTGAQAFF